MESGKPHTNFAIVPVYKGGNFLGWLQGQSMAKLVYG
jgi:hypothetical protein